MLEGCPKSSFWFWYLVPLNSGTKYLYHYWNLYHSCFFGQLFFPAIGCPVGCSLMCQNIMKLWPKLIECQLQPISTVFWICTIGFPPLNLTFYGTGAQPGVLSHAKVSSDSDITRSNANQYHNGTYLYLLLILLSIILITTKLISPSLLLFISIMIPP